MRDKGVKTGYLEAICDAALHVSCNQGNKQQAALEAHDDSQSNMHATRFPLYKPPTNDNTITSHMPHIAPLYFWFYAPGSTSFAPTKGAANTKPHEFAWNMGTMAMQQLELLMGMESI
jgi:hypothetical protein